MLRNVLLFLLAYQTNCECFSQQYPFVHYTPKDGLVNNRARAMFQDSKGRLYIATYGGLSVYDGSRFTNYTIDDGLLINLVNDVLELGPDSLLVVPNFPGLHSLVRGKLGSVRLTDTVKPVVNKMIKSADGSIFALADEGLFRFDKDHFTRINLIDKTGADANHFLVTGSIIKDKLFLITDIGINKFPGPGRLLVYDLNSHQLSVSKISLLNFVVASPEGYILVSTTKGIRRVDEDSLAQGNIQLLSMPFPYKAAELIAGNYLYFDHQQNLWISTGNGAVKINRQGQVKTFSTQNGLPVNLLASIFQDQENSMWFANEQTGISKLANPQFEFYSQIKPGFIVRDIYATSNSDSVWFLDQSHNKVLIQHKNGSFEYPIKPSHSGYNFIASQGNTNYLVDVDHIYQYESLSLPGLRTPHVIHTDTSKKDGFSSALLDSHGNLLVSYENIMVILKNKKIISYPLGYLTGQVVLTDNNQLWAVTRSGKMYFFKIHPEDPDHYLQLEHVYFKDLPMMSPRSITVDKEGNVWVGCRDQGLFRLLFNGGELRSWKQFTTKDGLSDNFISYLHTDDENNIWVGSPGGLDKVQFNNDNFFIENVTRSNNIYQFVYKIVTNKLGETWVLTAEGIIKIAPVQTRQPSFQPRIIFTAIKASRNMIQDLRKPLSISHKENDLSFYLAAPSFIDERQTRFSFLLEGSGNKLWSEPSTQAEINFANLPPGSYTLRAKAIFPNGIYPDTQAAYSFIIMPPWWQTWWFKILIGLFVIGFSVLMVRIYYRRKLEKQRVILEKQQAVEKERGRIATDMHDDLGAGLSTIRFLSEKVKRNTFSEITKTDIEKMQLTSGELMEKMNEIIWAMSEKNDSLEDLLFYTRSYAKEYCEDNNLNCSIQLPENIPALFVSGEMRRNIFLTVKETLHNIVKHAKANYVEIDIQTTKGLDITITDNGKGFEETGGQRSGGNGLRNMQKRMESIGGTLNIQNGDGVMVELKVPFT